MTPAESITRARTQLLMLHPFFGSLALRLRVVETRAVPTAGVAESITVNGTILAYNPDFIAKLSPQETMAVVAHEVLHCAFKHIFRLADREPMRWNIAADLAINPLIQDQGMRLPQGALLDDKYRDMEAETIYARLPEDPK